MKKAEEYIENIDSYLVEEVLYQFPLARVKFLEIIKQAQIDAIDAAVKICAETAKMSHEYYSKEDNYKKYCEFEETYPTRCDYYGEPIGVDVFQVNKGSILQVADKLKKEL